MGQDQRKSRIHFFGDSFRLLTRTLSYFEYFATGIMAVGFPRGARTRAGKSGRFTPGSGGPVQCSCLEKPMGRGAWQAAVLRVAVSQTGLSTDRTVTQRVTLVLFFFLT